MIVVLGRPAVADGPAGPVPAGLPSLLALAVARAGGRVELVGTLADDAAGDAVAVALARAGVGHAALLRVAGATTADPTRLSLRLDPADVELGLRYLTDFRVLLVADALEPETAAVAIEAAAYADAAVVIVVPAGATPPGGIGLDATVLEAPADAAGPFADAVARFALGLEAGTDPGAALRQASAEAGWEPVA